MNDNNTTGEGHVDGQTESATSVKATSEQANQDPIKQIKGEFTRKFSKINEKLDAVLNQFKAGNRATGQLPVEETTIDTDVKQYVDTVFTHQKQVDAWQNALDMFPELNPDSEQFDEGFYKAVDAEFSTNQRKDPKGPLKAAKLVALEMGKIEQLTRQNLLKDDARRSRILSEGASTPRESKKEKDPASSFNVKGLARLGIDPEKLAKRIKANKDKYE